MATIDELRALAREIREERQIGGNTGERVGNTFEKVADLLDSTGGDISDIREAVEQLLQDVGFIPRDISRTATDAVFTNSEGELLFWLRAATDTLAGLITAANNNKLIALPTAEELAQALAAKQNRLTFDPRPIEGSTNPVTSDGINTAIANFVTRSVSDLIYYYTKSETYTKEEVNALVAAIKQFVPVVAQTLPTPSADTMYKLYLIPSEDPQEGNIKDEYITIDNGASANPRYTWEKIGSVDIDISGKADIGTVPVDVTRTQTDVTFVNNNHDPLFYLRQATSSLAGLMTSAEHNKLGALPTAQDLNTRLEGTIYDISVLHPTSGVSGGNTYASLSAALAVIPQDKHKGGMTVRYIQSSDNNYVQYRYMGTETTGNPNPFLDTANWQGVDDEPTAESDNLVKSGGVYNDSRELISNVEGYLGVSFVKTSQSGYLNESGAYAGRSSWDSISTQLIPCSAGDIFMYKGYANANAVSALFFDSSKNIVGNSHLTNQSVFIEITVPSGASYAQFSSANGKGATIIFDLYKKNNLEHRVINLEQKDVKLQSNIDAEKQKRIDDNSKFVVIRDPWPNYYNPEKEKPNTVINSSGVEEANTKYTTNEEYIAVNQGQYLSVKGSTESNGNGVAFILYYDENKTYIARSRTSTQTDAIYNLLIETVKYIRVCVWKGSTDVAVYVNDENPNYDLNTWKYTPYGVNAATIKKEAMPEGYDEVEDAVKVLDIGYKDEDITDKKINYYTSAYINNSGEIVASGSWKAYRLKLSDISNYQEIIIKSYTSSTIRVQAAFYSSDSPANNNYIAGSARNFTAVFSTLVIKVSDIPANAVSLLMTNYFSDGDIQVLIKSDEKTSAIDVLQGQDADVNALLLRQRRAAFDAKFNSIAYSAMTVSGMGPNSEEHYVWCAQRGYTAIKGDVRISSDGEIVMCHDEGFTLNGSGEVVGYDAQNMTPIRDMTAAECFALVYAGTNNNHVCGINSLIRTCKLYGKIAFITVRSSYLDEIIPKILEALERYGMKERAIINGFSYDTLKFIRRYDLYIMLSWVQTYNHQVTTADVDQANSLGNCLISCYDYSGANPTTHTNQNDAVLAYAQSKDIRMYEAMVYDSALLTNTFYDRGFTGCQIGFEIQ